MKAVTVKKSKPVPVPGPNWTCCNSVGRPRALIDWVIEHSRARTPNDDLGPAFWKLVREYWSTFDRVEHDMFGMAFARFKPYWKPQPEWNGLPKRITVWRGGDRYRVRKGLSWTMDRSVAEDFARGHRFIFNKYPTLLTAEIDRTEVALVDNTREERELVLWSPLFQRAQRVPFTPDRTL